MSVNSNKSFTREDWLNTKITIPGICKDMTIGEAITSKGRIPTEEEIGEIGDINYGEI